MAEGTRRTIRGSIPSRDKGLLSLSVTFGTPLGPVQAIGWVPLSLSVGKWPGREFESHLNKPSRLRMHGTLQLLFYMPSRCDQGLYTHAQTHTVWFVGPCGCLDKFLVRIVFRPCTCYPADLQVKRLQCVRPLRAAGRNRSNPLKWTISIFTVLELIPCERLYRGFPQFPETTDCPSIKYFVSTLELVSVSSISRL